MENKYCEYIAAQVNAGVQIVKLAAETGIARDKLYKYSQKKATPKQQEDIDKLENHMKLYSYRLKKQGEHGEAEGNPDSGKKLEDGLEDISTPSEISLRGLVELTTSNRILAEASKIQADANKTLAENQQRLIVMLEQFTAIAPTQKGKDADSIYQVALELSVALSSGKRFHSVEEARAFLVNRQLFADVAPKPADIHTETDS